MSLNRFEQGVFDYLQSHPTEKQFWREKAHAAVRGSPAEAGGKGHDRHAAARSLERELWRYCEERSASVPHFREAGPHPELKRISLRNLAELMLRLWVPEDRGPRPGPPAEKK